METGALKIRHILAKRRLLFCQNILKRNQNDILRKVYEAQKSDFENKFDWFQTVQKDRLYYEIGLSDQEISDLSKSAFKKIVLKQINMKSICEFRESNQSKVQHILRSVQPDKKFKLPIQPYLKSQVITTVMKQQLFSLRNRSYDLKSNYKSLYVNDMICRICMDDQSREDEIHTFELCTELIERDQSDIKFIHVYGSLEQQIKAITYFSRISTKRNLILEIKNKK